MAEKSQSRAPSPPSPLTPTTSRSPSTSAMTGRTKESESPAAPDRRRRVGLRRLIDEMLAEIRAAASEENWTHEARAEAEADLARIMDQVREAAVRGGAGKAKGRSAKGKRSKSS